MNIDPDKLGIDTSGVYRVMAVEDKYFVTGNGMFWPMDDLKSAQVLVYRLKNGKNKT
jgi:hypothetical protein|tara:strand:+ start:3525 stop:3695 length:171 start_codon:yes stop_codon:yes gene_type:complete